MTMSNQDTPIEGQQTPGSEQENEVQQLKDELAALKDKYLRSVADMENMRRQNERRLNDRVKQEKKLLLLKVIDIVDDLDRALIYQDVADRDTLLASLRFMHQQINQLLQREGVSSISATGEMFDPRKHDAVEQVHDIDAPEGQIVQEMQKGYLFGEDLLRPSRVHVSSGSADQATTSEKQA